MSIRVLRAAILASLVSGLATAQFGQQQVLDQGRNTWCVHAADLNGDGMQDVLVGQPGNGLAWFENHGGGTFGSRQAIAGQAVSTFSVYAADLDGDGDSDVLGASFLDSTIFWHENIGLASGTFGGQAVISTQATRVSDIHAADVDGDGDLDVLHAGGWEGSGGKVAWYENLGVASAMFGPQRQISILDQGTDVHAADLDGDGDIDVLTASQADDKIAWYENAGNGSFGPQIAITTQASYAQAVQSGDIDGDGDLDVISASFDDDKIAWYENLGSAVFGPQRVITLQADAAIDVFLVDLNGDGQLDVISASNYGDRIAWHENVGGGNFGPIQPLGGAIDGPTSVYAADLDGDGDADVISCSENPPTPRVVWHENLLWGPIGVIYCAPAAQNSTGVPGRMSATGSVLAAGNALTLMADQLPLQAFGYFLTSQMQAFIVSPGGSQGILCLGGGIGRFTGPNQILNTGMSGSFRLSVELQAMPTPTGLVLVAPGETWNFQAWHRDANPTSTSNFTGGISVSFL